MLKIIFPTIIVFLLSCRETKQIIKRPKDDNTIVYIMPSDVEGLLQKELKKTSASIVFRLGQVGSNFQLDMFENEAGHYDALSSKTNRKICLNGVFFPLVFDFDEWFAVENSETNVREQFGSVKYPEFTKRVVIHHYYYSIVFTKDGKVLSQDTACPNVTIDTIAPRNEKKDINFIIMIDEDIRSGLSGFNLYAVNEGGEKENIKADYCPGSLTLDNSEYEKLLASGTKTVLLEFYYSEFQKKNPVNYHYEIDIRKGWLNSYFYILRIYNMSKGKYKKLFPNPDNKAYLYDWDFPGGGVRLIQRG